MANDDSKTICGIFKTREAAERAVEHLVQEKGLSPADIFIQASEEANTAGAIPSGSDVARGEAERSDLAPALNGEIQISVNMRAGDVAKAEEALLDAGATTVVK